MLEKTNNLLLFAYIVLLSIAIFVTFILSKFFFNLGYLESLALIILAVISLLFGILRGVKKLKDCESFEKLSAKQRKGFFNVLARSSLLSTLLFVQFLFLAWFLSIKMFWYIAIFSGFGAILSLATTILVKYKV